VSQNGLVFGFSDDPGNVGELRACGGRKHLGTEVGAYKVRVSAPVGDAVVFIQTAREQPINVAVLGLRPQECIDFQRSLPRVSNPGAVRPIGLYGVGEILQIVGGHRMA
jgi:hypothetical protein